MNIRVGLTGGRFHGKITIAFFSAPILTHYRSAMPFGKRKKYSRGWFQISIVIHFKKYHPSENLKFNNLGIFRSLKLPVLMGKILSISLKLNFFPNSSGCYGLTMTLSQ